MNVYADFDVFESAYRKIVEQDIRLRMDDRMQWLVYIMAIVVGVIVWPVLAPCTIKRKFKNNKEDQNNG